MEAVLILLLALAYDLLLGEPPAALHPVVWMGKVISLLERGAFSQNAVFQLACGAFMVALCLALFVVPAWLVLRFLEEKSPIAYVLAGAYLLKGNLSVRELARAAGRVRSTLAQQQLEKARTALGALVSRDTRTLSPSLVAAAAVESVAENTADSIIAPLFYFALFGVPGALAYRVVNTLDSMVGYHGRYEYLGKAAARLDDLLNLVPSRLTALLMVVVAPFAGARAASAWRVMWRDHALTESPNAGWSMSAAAGALGVTLEKVGHYRLGEAPAEPSEESIGRAVRMMYYCVALAVLAYLVLQGVGFVRPA